MYPLFLRSLAGRMFIYNNPKTTASKFTRINKPQNTKKPQVEESKNNEEKEGSGSQVQVQTAVRADSTVYNRFNTFQNPDFATFDGYHRLALKGRRGVVVSDSSVPPIVSSLKRTTWSTMTKKEKSAATEARADFHLRASSN